METGFRQHGQVASCPDGRRCAGAFRTEGSGPPKDKYIVRLGGLENPVRYFASYGPTPWFWSLAEPEEFKSTPFHFHEYDTSGHELAHRRGLQRPLPAASYSKALFGAATPMTEAAALVGAWRVLALEKRRQGGNWKPLLLDYLENSRYYIPDTSVFEETPSGLVPGFIALIVLSAAAGAIGCWLLARRYAFSRGRASVGTRWFLLWLGRVAPVARATAMARARLLPELSPAPAGHTRPV